MLRVLALTAWLWLFAHSAQATGVRCNPDLVEVGDEVSELLRMCGQPLVRTGVAPEETVGPVLAIEQWTYSVGPGTFVRVDPEPRRTITNVGDDPVRVLIVSAPVASGYEPMEWA